MGFFHSPKEILLSSLFYLTHHLPCMSIANKTSQKCFFDNPQKHSLGQVVDQKQKYKKN